MAWITELIFFTLLVYVQVHHTTVAAAANHPAEEVPIRSRRIIVNDDVPESCKDKTYCTIKPDDYPEEQFNEMFKGYTRSPQPSLIVELNNRQAGPDDEDNCETDVTYEPLYKVRENKDEPWRTVIQAPGQDFVQRVRMETCKNPDAPCFNEFTSSEYVTFCKQKVNAWKVLVALDNDESEFIIAELPVCCSCHYRPVNFVTRFGKPKYSKRNQ